VDQTEASHNLARTLLQLRELRALTQQQLAQLSGVPRPTIATLESGGANPTMSVLVRLGAALQVTLDELLSPPRATARLYRASELPERTRGDARLRALVPDAIPGIVVERMALPRGARLVGVPHKPGTREYLTCEHGRIELVASGATYELDPGDVVVFRGDQRHSYRNLAKGETVAYSVVLPG
jgi:transcriptional regulator with XRE-family HTH domain